MSMHCLHNVKRYHQYAECVVYQHCTCAFWCIEESLELVYVQITIPDITAAQLVVQSEFQNYSISPTKSEQMLQIIVFVAMIVGAGFFFVWNVKPFLRLYSQVCEVQNSAQPAAAASCSVKHSQSWPKVLHAQ